MSSGEDGWRGFLELCSKAKTPEMFQHLFDLFLTLEEKEILGSRYSIIKALAKGQMTQRTIAGTHKVSIAQITRGSNALKIIDAKFRKFLEANIE